MAIGDTVSRVRRAMHKRIELGRAYLVEALLTINKFMSNKASANTATYRYVHDSNDYYDSYEVIA